MKRRNPSIATSVSSATTATGAFTGTAADVLAQCSYPVLLKDGTESGLYHSSAVSINMYAFKADSDEGILVKGFNSLFSNSEYMGDLGAGAALAHATTAALVAGESPDPMLVFKLTNASNMSTVFSSHTPDYEATATATADGINAAAAPAKPDARYCAYLNVYADVGGKAVRVAQQAIPARMQSTLNNLTKMCAQGLHLELAVEPSARLSAWLATQNQPAESVPSADDINAA